MGKIHELPKSSSHLLSSSQIISSVYSVVKELLENALDSGAKNVEVKLEDYGLDKIEIKDNGFGIDKNDIQFVAKPHFTSKITSLSDLDSLNTYGFRGEALGAVCAVANLIVNTKSAEDNAGSSTNFGNNGQVLSTKPCPCPQGTTVSVLNLFQNIPVRRQYYRSEKNKKDELRKVEELLRAYGIIQNDVRFALLHNKNLIWQKTALSSAKDALIQTLGNATFKHMEYVDFLDEKTQRKIEMYLPRLDAPSICGFSSSSKCVVAVNKRPVRLKAVDKLLKDYYNECIKNSGRARYPICYVSFTLPFVEVDVNVEPNKTAVMLHHSEEILAQFSDILKKFYSCEETNQNLNTDVPILQGPSSSNQKPKSNANDFPASLNTSCDKIKSRLSFVADSAKAASNASPLQCHNTMNRKDISRIGKANEPRKKKLKTNSQPLKDLNNHLSTLSNFFSNDGTSPKCPSIYDCNNSPTVTVRKPSTGGLFGVSQSSVSEPSKIATFPVPNDFGRHSSVCDQDILVVNKVSSMDADTENRVTTFAVTNNLHSNVTSVLDQEKGNFNRNQTSVMVNNTERSRIVNFATASESCGNRTVSDQCKVQTAFNANIDVCRDKTAPKLSDVENKLTMTEELAVDKIHSVTNNKNLLIHKSIPTSVCSDNSKKTPVANVCLQNGTSWSRGVHVSGVVIQPVAVLQPKPLAASEARSKESTVDKPNQKVIQKSLSFERKLTAFDIFCRSNRLEVAAQNPEFSNQMIAQVLTEKWSKLTAEEKALFKNMLDKDYSKEIKNKERLGKTIIQNLNQDNKKDPVLCTSPKKKFKIKHKNKTLMYSMKRIKSSIPLQEIEHNSEDLNIVSNIVPGIWICTRRGKLFFLNTFQLQETIIYHRLLETYHFDSERLEAPVHIPASHLGDDAMAVLCALPRDSQGNICNQHLTAHGFNVKLIRGENGQVNVELVGIANYCGLYEITDLKEILILMKKAGCSVKLSDCRPKKVLLFLKGEANRMCNQSPACQRLQDVEELLIQREAVIPNDVKCIHGRTFLHELWQL